MIDADPFRELPVAPRCSNHRGEWVPLYLEPLPGSAEKLCIGVIATDGNRVTTMPVPRLHHLESAFGVTARAFAWSAHLVMVEAKILAERSGIRQLADSLAGIEGVSVGDQRVGAGVDLDDLATLALRQSSTLVMTHLQPEAGTWEQSVGRAEPIAKAVRRAATLIRPELRDSFGRQFRFSEYTRPTAYGFVGRRIVANFASLGGVSIEQIGGQMDRAKARLWDLEQLQQGVLRDVLGAPMKQSAFELLACPPPKGTEGELAARSVHPAQLTEAAQTLEREADKFDIRWRYLRNPQEVAGVILRQEAA